MSNLVRSKWLDRNETSGIPVHNLRFIQLSTNPLLLGKTANATKLSGFDILAFRDQRSVRSLRDMPCCVSRNVGPDNEARSVFQNL